ncbi:MAG: hypothetical protein KA149_06455, partial [Chitinophagales bacterium]|nr:hypothetical protein [Chitinophagales bacterium]
ADGHDFASLEKAKANINSTKPTAIICDTTKGKGWITYEDKLDCHYLAMKDDQYELVLNEVERDFNNRISKLAN